MSDHRRFQPGYVEPAAGAEIVEAELLDGEIARVEPGADADAPAPTEVLTHLTRPGDADAPTWAPAGAAAVADPAPRPTIRWGALVWALLFAAAAGYTLWLLASEQHRDDAVAWLQSVPLGLLPLYGLAAIGVVVALFGGVGLIRRAERKRRAARG